MKKDIIIAENFYKDPYKVREYALHELLFDRYLPYGTKDWYANNFKEWYECPFKSSESLINNLEFLTGEELDRENWQRSRPNHPHDNDGKRNHEEPKKSPKWNCTFHIKPLTGQRLGDCVHNHVTDWWNSLEYNDWVGLIYLNPEAPIDSGLFLWENIDKKNNFDWMSKKENWKLIDSLGAVFNRLILCRAQKPHSGADGFSNVFEEGRLYQTFFFKTKNKRITTSTEVDLIKHNK